MRTFEFPQRTIEISGYDLTSVARVSRRLADGEHGLSSNEHNAAAIINGRLDRLEDEDFRRVLIRMGREWSHAVVAQIFEHWENEMTLGPNHPNCPVGDQRISTK